MIISKLLGILLLVFSLFILAQSAGWNLGYKILLGVFALIGLILVVRRPSRGSSTYLKRTKRAYIEAQLPTK